MSVRIDDADGVRVVSIDRPEKRNAIDRHVYVALDDAFREALERDDIGALVLTGTGTEAFSSGADRDELAALTAGTGQDFSRAANRFCDMLRIYPKPVVMAVNGVAVGMGTTLLGYADVAFAAERARFRTPFTAMGISPELGSSWLLPQLVGWQRASWMLLSSEWVDARTAADWGLVVDVVADDDLLTHATRRGADDRRAQPAVAPSGEADDARVAHRVGRACPRGREGALRRAAPGPRRVPTRLSRTVLVQVRLWMKCSS